MYPIIFCSHPPASNSWAAYETYQGASRAAYRFLCVYVNVEASSLLVVCVGYTGNGFTCVDVNECQVNNGGCSLNPYVQCINTPGSRTCQPCPDGIVKILSVFVSLLTPSVLLIPLISVHLLCHHIYVSENLSFQQIFHDIVGMDGPTDNSVVYKLYSTVIQVTKVHHLLSLPWQTETIETDSQQSVHSLSFFLSGPYMFRYFKDSLLRQALAYLASFTI